MRTASTNRTINMPLKIAIVGAGLGGLTAALALSRQDTGHEIHVYEKHATLSNRGSGIMVRPNASRILSRLGPDVQEEFDRLAERSRFSLLRSVTTGKIAMRSILVDVSTWPDWGMRREDIQSILYQKIEEAGLKVTFNTEVSAIVEQGLVTLKLSNGNAEGGFDLVLAADGIRSRIRSLILGDRWSPEITNLTLYGTQIDSRLLLENEVTQSLMKEPCLNVSMGKGVFLVSSSSTKNHRWSGLYGVIGESDQRNLWDENGDIEFVRKSFAHTCPEIRATLEMAERCDRWKIAQIPDLPRWCSESGRVILLGDSAHGMTPHAAQGYSMIVEDIGVLSHLLGSMNGSVPMITATWEKIRKPRVERIKAYARWNGKFFTQETPVANDDDKQEFKSLQNIVPQMSASFHSAAFNKWALDHDVIDETDHVLQQMSSRL